MIVAGVSLWIVSRSLLQCSEDHGAEHEQGGDDEDDQQFADHGTGTRRVSSSNQFWTSTTWMGVSLSAVWASPTLSIRKRPSGPT